MTTHNGWSSYETWLVNCWITHDESTQTYWEAVTRDAVANCDAIEQAVDDIAEMLEAEFGIEPTGLSGLQADLFRSAAQEIDWQELAENLVKSAVDE